MPTWNEAQFEYLGVGPFSAPGHLLGTTNDGYDMLSGLINGARISIFVSIISVTIGGLLGGAIGIAIDIYDS